MPALGLPRGHRLWSCEVVRYMISVVSPCCLARLYAFNSMGTVFRFVVRVLMSSIYVPLERAFAWMLCQQHSNVFRHV